MSPDLSSLTICEQAHTSNWRRLIRVGLAPGCPSLGAGLSGFGGFLGEVGGLGRAGGALDDHQIGFGDLPRGDDSGFLEQIEGLP
jgi:hypothetical protein